MRAAIIVLLVLTVGLLAWGGGELHYRGCVDAAKGRYPPEVVSSTKRESILDPTETRRRDANAGSRRSAIDGCSRLPF
jgi:hypothetical protein